MPVEQDLDCIDLSGGLFTEQLVRTLRQPEPSLDEVQPESFQFDGFEPRTVTELDQAIGRTWDKLKEKWDRFYNEHRSRDTESLSVSEARKLWILPLFSELGYEPEWISSALEVGGKSFNLAHYGWDAEDAPVLHSVKPEQGLDDVPEGAGRGTPSPHDLVQEVLNLSTKHRWALLTNGLKFRILRDFHHTTTQGYIEFDLLNIFETRQSRQYQDFQALFRMGHPSRLRKSDGHDEILEQIYEESRQTGVSVGKDLRGNVRKAIEVLGNGFLKDVSKEPYRQSDENCESFYSEILTVIYRMLFLLFAEQEGMVPSGKLVEQRRDEDKAVDPNLYIKEYSMEALRTRAEQGIPADEKNTDLWEGLKITFRMLNEGCQELGVFPFNGELFEIDKEFQITDLACPNHHLLKAVRYLTLIERDDILQRIDYGHIGVEEIGAIYENLLDYQPRVPAEDEEVDGEVLKANRFVLDPRGSERKGSGSYYTDPKLVNQLIETALRPVIDERLENANTQEEKEEALLDIKVCDPACGSAAFLIKANNELAQRLAKVRTDSDYPSERQVTEAKRDVLQHCIYGVDLNPMAVELAKVSLWINASVEDKPLNFLNHRIKCGNSLIGTLPGDIERGIDQETFSLSNIPEGDDRELVKELRKRSRKENKGIRELDFSEVGSQEAIETDFLAEMEDIPEESVEDVALKKEHYSDYLESDAYQYQKFIHDLWTSAYFWKNTDEWNWYPTPEKFERAKEDPSSVPNREREEIRRLAEVNKFFHWHLAFPEIFGNGNEGFDCVLGNPPWGKVEFQEKKYFAGRNEEIVNASNKSERQKVIGELEEVNRELYEQYLKAKRLTDCQSKFMRESGRYPFTGKGKLNTYSVFAELDRNLMSDIGSVGVVIPSGLATDKTTAEFFRDLMEKRQIESMFDFENSEGLFSEVHRSYKFSLFTLRSQEAGSDETDFAYFLTNLDHLSEEDRHFTLTPDEIKLLNPNTRTCPVFRSKTDAELTKKLYRQSPVLINEETGENPWGVSFRQGLFNMSSDSHLFKTREELESEGFELEGNHFVNEEDRWLPLYEAKMFHQFDHRYGSFEDSESRTNVQLKKLTPQEKSDPNCYPEPWYWVEEEEVESFIDSDLYFLAFRDIARNTDERTAIFSFIPRAGVGHTSPLVCSEEEILKVSCLLANVNSFIFDFIIRQKLGGTHLTYFILKQLPVLEPDQYSEKKINLLVPNAVELTFTATDMVGYVEKVLEKVGQEKWNEWFPENKVRGNQIPEPFEWNEERRFQLRCELDAIYGHLYNVAEDDLGYILDTFPIVKRKDEEVYGTYRTKEKILKEYRKLS